jgi:hypothetical protein
MGRGSDKKQDRWQYILTSTNDRIEIKTEVAVRSLLKTREREQCRDTELRNFNTKDSNDLGRQFEIIRPKAPASLANFQEHIC